MAGKEVSSSSVNTEPQNASIELTSRERRGQKKPPYSPYKCVLYKSRDMKIHKPLIYATPTLQRTKQPGACDSVDCAASIGPRRFPFERLKRSLMMGTDSSGQNANIPLWVKWAPVSSRCAPRSTAGVGHFPDNSRPDPAVTPHLCDHRRPDERE